MIYAYSEVPILSQDVAPSARNLVGQRHIGQDRASEFTSQQAAFRMPTSILAAAAYILIIPGVDKSIGFGLSVLSATDENWAKTGSEQHSFKLEWAGFCCY